MIKVIRLQYTYSMKPVREEHMSYFFFISVIIIILVHKNNHVNAQLCPTLWHPTDYTAHGILQARTLEWVAFPFSRGSSQARDQTQVRHIAGRFFTS